MTVAGLWQLLRKNGLVVEVEGMAAREAIQGQKIAVDISMWVVQGETAQVARLDHYMLVSFWRVVRYLRAGALPVAVVEGECPARKRRRRQNDGTFAQAVRHVAKLFEALGCPVAQAGGEADGCCAKLSQAGFVDAIGTCDSDVFPFGCASATEILKTVEAPLPGDPVTLPRDPSS